MAWRFVVVSGNSGAGKSTLLRQIAADLRKDGLNVGLADERQLHHRLLAHMFSDPVRWAYAIQVNFIVQRFARLLEASCEPYDVLLMERCFWEDKLFFRYYREIGAIPIACEPIYDSLLKSFIDLTVRPSLIVHLNAEVNSSCERLERAFKKGERDEELRGDGLRRYITSMKRLYGEWSQQALDICAEYVEFDVDLSAITPREISREVRARLQVEPG
jgi:deoxyadenosine/deoxycytidine kinase